MGFFSKLFGGNKSNTVKIVHGATHGKDWITASRFNQAKGGFAGGYAAITFGNIINAHSCAEDIVDEFGLDEEGCEYCDCYSQALAIVTAEAEEEMAMDTIDSIFEIFDGDSAEIGMDDLDIEDYIDYEEVEELAYEMAVEVAQTWIDGSAWIPDDVLDWAYYEVSDHNG